MSIFGKVAGAILGLPFGISGFLLGLIVGHLVDLMSERGWSPESQGSEMRELVSRLFALWGSLVAYSGGLQQSQALFLQSVFRQLSLSPGLAKEAQQTFEEVLVTGRGRTWTHAVDNLRGLADEIYADFFLDRRTLLWVYETSRRLVALGTVRPGVVELLDTLAKSFHIFEEVGSAGVSSQSHSERYDQTWQGFRPATSAGPEAFAVLGLSASASDDEVKKAYRTLVRQYHPDSFSRMPDSDPLKKQAAERFLQVQQAYERIRKDRHF